MSDQKLRRATSLARALAQAGAGPDKNLNRAQRNKTGTWGPGGVAHARPPVLGGGVGRQPRHARVQCERAGQLVFWGEGGRRTIRSSPGRARRTPSLPESSRAGALGGGSAETRGSSVGRPAARSAPVHAHSESSAWDAGPPSKKTAARPSRPRRQSPHTRRAPRQPAIASATPAGDGPLARNDRPHSGLHESPTNPILKKAHSAAPGGSGQRRRRARPRSPGRG